MEKVCWFVNEVKIFVEIEKLVVTCKRSNFLNRHFFLSFHTVALQTTAKKCTKILFSADVGHVVLLFLLIDCANLCYFDCRIRSLCLTVYLQSVLHTVEICL